MILGFKNQDRSNEYWDALENRYFYPSLFTNMLHCCGVYYNLHWLCPMITVFRFYLVGARDQTWSTGKGYENQDPGGDLPVFSANQGTKFASFELHNVL